METTALIARLGALALLDHDAQRILEAALEKIPAAHGDVRDALRRFRDDHRRHVEVLGQALAGLGGSLPSFPGEVTGDAAQAMAAVRSAFTPAGVLEALQGNERLLDRDYDAAVMAVEYDDYPQGVQLALQDCYADEQEHLSTVEEFLDRFAAPAP